MFEVKAKTQKPLLNESYLTIRTGESTFTNQPFDYANFMSYIKKTPEAIGIIRALITDVLSDGVNWKGGKNKIQKAKNFCKKTQFWTKRLPASQTDWFIFGNSLMWTGMTTKQYKELVYDVVSKNMPEFKAEYKQEITNDLISSNGYNMLDFRVVPWSTVSINTDATDIISFTQNVNNAEEKREWKADEVIHATLMDMDGKAYGYSPMIAATSVISTLALIKDYNGYFFDNGGEPDLMFVFPDEYADNPQVETLKRMLQEKKRSRNKRGHMVITGQCDIKRVKENEKDMDYRLLAIYYTGILAFSFNMPLSRIQSIIGSEVKIGNSDLSDSGYWRNISHMQRYWEEILNDNIFKPYFDVEFSFKRSYKQDEVRESQAKIMNVTMLKEVIQGLKLKPSKNYIKTLLNVDDDDFDWDAWEKLKPEQLFSIEPSQGAPQPSNNDLFKTESQLANDENKRKAALSKTNSP